MTREATKKEIKAYEKVENLLTMEEMRKILLTNWYLCAIMNTEIKERGN